MKQVVIVGAGPIGLYLANRLHALGVKDILVVDPRAGDYRRPGLLVSDVFSHMHVMIGTSKLPPEQHGHIKDAERALFQQAQARKIQILNARFLRLESHGERGNGVIVINGEEELFVPCHYVFDCSGLHRVVLEAVNALTSEPIFNPYPVYAKHMVTQHFIAYVRKGPDYSKPNSGGLSPDVRTQDYVNGLSELFQLGWSRFVYPFILAHNFGNKVCLYMEQPEGLPPERYADWVNALMRASSPAKTSSWEMIPSERKSTVRYQSFRVAPQRLNRHFYQHPGYPMVMAHGDTQIEPMYLLGNGMLQGMKRVDVFCTHLIVTDGKLHINAEAWSKGIEGLLSSQQERIFNYDPNAEMTEKSYYSFISQRFSSGVLQATTPALEHLKMVAWLRYTMAKIPTILKNIVNSSETLKDLSERNLKIKHEMSEIADYFQQQERLLSFPEEYKAFCEFKRQYEEQWITALINFSGQRNNRMVSFVFYAYEESLPYMANCPDHKLTMQALEALMRFCMQQEFVGKVISYYDQALNTLQSHEFFVFFREELFCLIVSSTADLRSNNRYYFGLLDLINRERTTISPDCLQKVEADLTFVLSPATPSSSKSSVHPTLAPFSIFKSQQALDDTILSLSGTSNNGSNIENGLSQVIERLKSGTIGF